MTHARNLGWLLVACLAGQSAGQCTVPTIAGASTADCPAPGMTVPGVPPTACTWVPGAGQFCANCALPSCVATCTATTFNFQPTCAPIGNCLASDPMVVGSSTLCGTSAFGSACAITADIRFDCTGVTVTCGGTAAVGVWQKSGDCSDCCTITVSLAAVTTTEAGGSATFTVVLSSAPTMPVTIPITVPAAAAAEGTVDVTSLTFDSSNFNMAQTVTVTGVDDMFVDGNVNWLLAVGPATSGDPGYAGVDPADVTVTNTDDDALGATIVPTMGTVTESGAGNTFTFTVVLNKQPRMDVVIPLRSGDVGEGTVMPAQLTFTMANWNVPQVVTVTGVVDNVVDGAQMYSIFLDPAGSGDAAWNMFDIMTDVAMTTTDSDVAGFDFTPTATDTPPTFTVTTEAGGTVTYAAKLTSQPTATVTVTLTSSVPAEGTVAPAMLVFTPANWMTAQTVIVTGVDDVTDDGDQAFTLTIPALGSGDAAYAAIDPADVVFTNRDNECCVIQVSVTNLPNTLEAGGGPQTFTVVLTTAPTAPVTVPIVSSLVTEGTVDKAALVFDAANFNVAQTVTVTGVDDLIVDGDTPYTIQIGPATSGDMAYQGDDPTDITVINTDDDVVGATVAPTMGTVTESGAGNTLTFTVVLNKQPRMDVVIPLRSGDVGEGTVMPAQLTFTMANWNVPQVVTVTGVVDNVVDGAQMYSIFLDPAGSGDAAWNMFDIMTDVAMTTTDSDVAGFDFTPTATDTPPTFTVTTEAGGTVTYAAKLTSQPTATVTVTLTSSVPAEGTVAPAMLVFTPANWMTAQTVIVTGVDDVTDDGDQAFTLTIPALGSGDAAYAAIDPADVVFTNRDNECCVIQVSVTNLPNTLEAGGGPQTFTVVLTTAPTAPVTVPIVSSLVTEGTVDKAALVFDATNFNVAQTVTVTGVDDLIVDGDTPYTIQIGPATSGDMAYQGDDPTDITVINTDDDVVGATVVPTMGTVTESGAGNTLTFTVVLNKQPRMDVVIPLRSGDVGEGTVMPAQLTFTMANWNVPQVVTVTGVVDNVVDGAQMYSIFLDPAGSGDAAWNMFDIMTDVAMTTTDSDVAGFDFTPTATDTPPTFTVTTEAGGTVTYAAKLTSQPTATVTVTLTSSVPAEGTVAPAMLVFTPANWMTAQTVIVTGVDDVTDDGDQAFTLTIPALGSGDAAYAAIDPADVVFTNRDNECCVIQVSVTNLPNTLEAGGGPQTFTVVLTTAPTAPVTVPIVSSLVTEGTVDKAALVFDAANFNVAQTVTVTGVDDLIVDGDTPYTIQIGPATSGDMAYQGDDPTDITVINTDDDVVGATVAPTMGTVTESGAGNTLTFTVVLNKQPRMDVVIPLRSGDVGEGTVMPAQLTFTMANWNVPQVVTVTGVVDNVVDGAQMYSIFLDPAGSGDAAWNMFDIMTDVAMTTTDSDVAGFDFTPTATDTPPTFTVTTEAGGTVTYAAKLTSQPTATVTVTLTSSVPAEGTVAPAMLVFTPANWMTAQTVIVTGVDDVTDDGDQAFTLTIPALGSGDAAYAAIDPADVVFTNRDNECCVIQVSVTNLPNTLEAGGGPQTFTVVLTTAPTAPVTVPIVSSLVTEGTVDKAALVFDAANFNVAQTVTVTGVDDLIVDGDTPYTIQIGPATSGDMAYQGDDPTDITVINTDDDVVGATVAPTMGTVTESGAGNTLTFTVVLNKQPRMDVVIPLRSGDVGEGTVMPAQLTFTMANWNVPQVVTVTGVVDNVVDGAQMYSIFLDPAGSGDAAWNMFDIMTDVAMTTTDSDVIGFSFTAVASTLPPGFDRTSEDGGAVTYNAVLRSKPSADVTVALTSSVPAEGKPDVPQLTFTTTNWMTPQVVTVTGIDDAVKDGDQAYAITFAPLMSADAAYSGLVTPNIDLTNLDNEGPFGIVVTAAMGLTTTEAGGTVTFTVVLRTQPTATVTIAITSSAVTEGTALPASLVFTTTNWATPQVVTVTGVDEMIADGDQLYSIMTGLAVSTDTNYGMLDAVDVFVTNTDDDTAGYVFSKTSVETSEAGVADSFFVSLRSQPTNPVTVPFSSSNTQEATVPAGPLTFTTTNWNVPQEVVVTGVDELIADGNQNFEIQFAVTQSTDTNYGNQMLAPVTGRNLDNDVASVVVATMPPMVTTEAGGDTGMRVMVSLGSQPTGNVIVSVVPASVDATEGTFAAPFLTFTPMNWNVAQPLTATGVDDMEADGDITYTVQLSATSMDASYNSIMIPSFDVTNTDDDTAGIIVAPAGPLATTEMGGMATFTVRLQSRPTDDVTIDVVSSDISEGTLDLSSITFTPMNWNTDVTVTVTGVQDFVADGAKMYTLRTLPAVSTDPKYSGLAGTVIQATNADDDTAGINAAPATPIVVDETGTTATFEVTLASQPTSDVTIPLTVTDASEANVLPTSLVFTPATWNVAQVVTVRGLDDNLDDGDQNLQVNFVGALGVRSLDSTYNGFVRTPIDVTCRDDDAVGVTVTPAATPLVTAETGTTATFTVVLDSMPTAAVTVTLTLDATEGQVDKPTLQFPVAAWNVPQVVTVTGLDDDLVDGTVSYDIAMMAASADAAYTLAVTPVAVENTDDDTAGIVIAPTAGLATTEAGGDAVFTIKMATMPANDVVFSLTSNDTTEGTLAAASAQVTFTPANWKQTQTITVSGVDDTVADGRVWYAILTGVVASMDPVYAGMNPPDVSLVNEDNETPGITVTPTKGLVTDEGGATAMFTMRLNTQPASDVRVPITHCTAGDLTEVTVAPCEIIFTPANWDTPVAITATGVNDDEDDGNQLVTIAIGAATTADLVYAGMQATSPVEVTNVDDDTTGIVVAPVSGLQTSEGGMTATFTVVLQSRPTATVTIPVRSSKPEEGTVDVAMLTFDNTNWNMAQTVTVTGVNDAIADGTVPYEIILDIPTTTDATYSIVDPANVGVNNADDDTVGITVTPTMLTTFEAGSSEQFSIVLTSQPTADVTVPLRSGDPTEGSVAVTGVTFTPMNWAIPQYVDVTPVDDMDVDGDKTYQITTGVASSTDGKYNFFAAAADVTVVNRDNDQAGYVITPTIALRTTEGGGKANFSIVLTSRPVSPVKIALSASDTTEAMLSESSITFSNSNWNVPQVVVVTGLDDFIDDGNVDYEVVIANAVSTDASYTGMTFDNVKGVNIDDDSTSILVSPLNITTTEAGGKATLRIRLGTQPVQDVTVPIASSNVNEATVNKAALVFTAANWDREQTVLVTGVDDTKKDGDVAYEITTGPSMSLDLPFNMVLGDAVQGLNQDNEIAGVLVSPTAGLVVREEGTTTDTFTLVLRSQPAQDVTVPVRAADPSQLSVSPTRVVFTPATWSTAQVVTVRALDDQIAQGERVVQALVEEVVSIDVAYQGVNPADVDVRIVDNDSPGVVVAPTTGLVTSEDGGTATFTVMLSAEPQATVTVAVASQNLAEGVTNAASLSFSRGTWNVPQTVTVTGVQDTLEDGSIVYQVNVGPTVSTDMAFNGLAGVVVSVENTDDDTAGITVNPHGGLMTTEEGGTDSFTVRLSTAPTADVSIVLRVGDASEGVIDKTELVFTAMNWGMRQTVTVTGVDDFEFDTDITYDIKVQAANSADPVYNNVAEVLVSVQNADNEVASVNVTLQGEPTTTEWGAMAKYLVVLTTPPTDRVTMTVTSSDVSEGTLSPNTLLFLPTSWNVPQTITVTGVDDMLEDGDVSYLVTIGAPTSLDTKYSSLREQTFQLRNINDDPNRPALCTDFPANACKLRPDANLLVCASSGCTARLCCQKCDTYSAAACNSRQLVANAALLDCPTGGCDANTCCYVPPPPPGAALCSAYRTACPLKPNPERIVCRSEGCDDVQCCDTCSTVFNTTACASGFLRVDADTTPCSSRGCDAALCCRPDKCFGVLCTPATQCHEPGTCDLSSGLCTSPLKQVGTTCDDGVDTTIRDACQAGGACAGVSKCAGVVCTAKSACHTVGICNSLTGVCSEPTVANGVPCNDGLQQTTDDTCTDGACAGTITCNGQVCRPSNAQCNTAGCGVLTGTANAPERCIELPKPDGISCDDGIPLTTEDTCRAGKCIGRGLCWNKLCTPKSQCHGSGVCEVRTGICTTPLLPDRTPCDDNDVTTTDDLCYKGTCIGKKKCHGVICRASTQCNRPGVCDIATGLCSDPFVASGTVCNDGDSFTSDDRCNGAGACVGKLDCLPCSSSEPQCHVARCAEGKKCTEVGRPDTTPCNDADIFTFNDRCVQGRCTGELLCAGVSCPADQCHSQGVCNPATGRCSTPVKPDNTPCNDGKRGTVLDVCISGVCTGKPACEGVVCPASSPCHGPGVCDPNTGLCTDPILGDGVPCDDQDGGTSGDMCLSGSCVGQTQCGGVTCVSTEPQCRRAYCTANRCAEVSRADNTVCNDNNPLTTGDKCTNGVCAGEAKCKNVICPVTDPCREASECNPVTGACAEVGSPKPDGTPCNDGKPTTTKDTCLGGTCVGTLLCELADCKTRDQCHEDGVCDPSTGLCTNPMRPDGTTCNDGDSSTSDDRCEAGACIGTVQCAGVVCLSTDPQCVRSVCDANRCIDIAKPDNTFCNDNNASTLNDVCISGKCVGEDKCAGIYCVPSSPCHEKGVCHHLTGVCSTPSKLDGSACDDGLVTTVNDKCVNGACIGTSLCEAVVCPATTCRSAGRCNPQTGLCESQTLPDGTECDDGDGATIDDKCTQEVCVGKLQCGARQCTVTEPQCHTAVCENGNCREQPKPEQTPCSDGTEKTTGDVCKAGVCVGTDLCANVVCSAVGQCYGTGVCNPKTGQCTTPVTPDGTICDDGIETTANDRCVNAKCVGKERCGGVVCAASDDCHDVGLCDPMTGLCTDPQKPSGTPCADGDVTTSNDKCIAGVCTGVVTCGSLPCQAAEPECNTASCLGLRCGQTAKVDGTMCNDNDATTFNDRCLGGKCVGKNKCDGVVCTQQSTNPCVNIGVCEPATGICTNTLRPDKTSCDDRDPKTADDSCRAGVCVGVKKCENVVCAASDGCHTVGECVYSTGLCSDPSAPDGTPCNDGNLFSTNDRCVSGVCIGTTKCSTAPACTVPDPQCSSAACDKGGCVTISKPDGTRCNDGNPSTTDDVCNAGKCTSTSMCDSVNCPAVMCREVGVCDAKTGACTAPPKPDGTPCDDQDPLTVNDVCDRGVCAGRGRCVGVVCSQKGQCIGAGTCSTATGVCVYSKVVDGALCNDGNSETVSDKCKNGVCSGAAPCAGKMCTATNPQCNLPACNANVCVELTKTDGTVCDDGDALTFDDVCTNGVCAGVKKCAAVVCQAKTTCHFEGTCEPSTGLCSTPIKPDGTACDDGNPLSFSSECKAGICVSNDKCLGKAQCAAQSECHDVGVCSPSTGECSNPEKPAGEPCNDGNPITDDDVCEAGGVCRGKMRCEGVVCANSDGCHSAGICNTQTGLCTDPVLPDGVVCDDSNAQTTGETCIAGQCVGQMDCEGTPCVTQDPQCQIATCNSGRCEHLPKPDGTKCNDGKVGTLNDKCVGGTCRGNSLCMGKMCSGGQCQNPGRCDAATGECRNNPKPNGTPCDDRNSNTYDDTCLNGRCQGRVRCAGVVCTPRSQCQSVGVCDLNTGLCTTPYMPNGSPCDDGRQATREDKCQSGVCVGVLVCGSVVCQNVNPQCAEVSCVGGRCVTNNAVNGRLCDDGRASTVEDKCRQGVCIGINRCASTACSPMSQCHDQGECEVLTGRCTTPLKAEGTQCDDKNPATTGDVCTGGVCRGVDKCAGVVCTASDQCHSTGICDSLTGLCTDPMLASGTACNDGNPGTTEDRCSSGACAGSVQCGGAVCRSANPACSLPVCTNGMCSEQPLSDSVLCNDNDPSTTGDQCNSGVCVGRNACGGIQCMAVSQCHETGSCMPQTGLCTSPPLPDGTSCDDSNEQTGRDQCLGGVCKGVPKCQGVVCKASDSCHAVGSCDQFTGLCSDPPKATGTPCNDLNAATVDDKCIAGICTGGVMCGGQFCISSNPQCMESTCFGTKCTEMKKPDGIACNDGDAATFSDTCQNGVCKGVDRCQGTVCTPRSQCHGAGVCDPTTGKCTSPVKPDGTVCNDQNPSTVMDKCLKGVCKGEDKCSSVVCTPSDGCHSPGACNPSTGLCSDPEKPSGSVCDDGNPDTTADKCLNGVCAGSLRCGGNDCAAPSPACKIPTCVLGACQTVDKPDGMLCNDGNPGTDSDVCRAGVCVGNAKCKFVTCTPSDGCHKAGVCNPITGTCSTPPEADGTACDDQNTLTFNDVCRSGVCVGRDKCAGVTCRATDDCHQDGSCDPATGLCTEPIRADNTLCNDGDVATVDDKCAAGACMGTVMCGLSRCRTQSACMRPSCAGTTCVEVARADGTPCNDGRSETTGDVCKSGRCEGTNACAGVTCKTPDQCHYLGECEVLTGRCTNPVKPDGTTCDDGLMTTKNDVCMYVQWLHTHTHHTHTHYASHITQHRSGVCKGTAKCTAGADTCVPSPCHTFGACNPNTGVCDREVRQGNVVCDDKDPNTVDDKCFNGVCRGVVQKYCSSFSGQCNIVDSPAAVKCPLWAGYETNARHSSTLHTHTHTHPALQLLRRCVLQAGHLRVLRGDAVLPPRRREPGAVPSERVRPWHVLRPLQPRRRRHPLQHARAAPEHELPVGRLQRRVLPARHAHLVQGGRRRRRQPCRHCRREGRHRRRARRASGSADERAHCAERQRDVACDGEPDALDAGP